MRDDDGYDDDTDRNDDETKTRRNSKTIDET